MHPRPVYTASSLEHSVAAASTAAPSAGPRPASAFSSSRPTSVLSHASSTGLSDEQRVHAFLADLTRLHSMVLNATQSNHAHADPSMQSYVLLRRSEHAAVRRHIIESAAMSQPAATMEQAAEEEEGGESDVDSDDERDQRLQCRRQHLQQPPQDAWSLLLSILRHSTHPTLLAHILAIMVLAAGSFRTEALAREWMLHMKETEGPTHGPSTTAEAATVSASHSPMQLWTACWSSDSAESSSPSHIYTRHLSSLLYPLLLSVHPRQRKLSSVLLKSNSLRNFQALQQLWSVGSELVLALVAGPSASASLDSMHQIQLDGFTFTDAFAAYLSRTLQQAPLLYSSTTQRALWRLMELNMELYLREERKEEQRAAKNTSSPASTHRSFGLAADTPMWLLLAACCRELCSAPAFRGCRCASSAQSLPNAAPAASKFDPYLASSSSTTTAASPRYLSLTASWLRLLAAWIDEPSKDTNVVSLLDRIPLVSVLILHVLCFHRTDRAEDDGAAGVNSANQADYAKSQLVLDAECIFTRYYFDDSKHMQKLLTLLPLSKPDETTHKRAPCLPTLALYLPPASECFMQHLNANICNHVKYQKQGMSCFVTLHFEYDAATNGSTSSIHPSAHTSHLTTVLVHLIKKFVVFKLDAAAPVVAASFSSPQAAVAAVTGATVRVVRDITAAQKVGSNLMASLVALLVGAVADATNRPQHQDNASLIKLLQSTLLEMYLWSPRQMIRFKELFDYAHGEWKKKQTQQQQATTSAAERRIVDVLYGLGMRVLLCLADTIATLVHDPSTATAAIPASAYSSMHDHATTATAEQQLFQLMREHIGSVLHSIGTIIVEGQSLGIHAGGSTTDGREQRLLQLGDIFDLTYRTSPLKPPTALHAAASYWPILQQVQSYIAAAATRLNPLSVGSMQGGGALRVSPFVPTAPPPSSSPLHSPRRPLRPFSSHARMRPAPPAAAEATATPSASSHHPLPPSSAPAGQAATPLAPLNAALSGSSDRHRRYKLADGGVAAVASAQPCKHVDAAEEKAQVAATPSSLFPVPPRHHAAQLSAPIVGSFSARAAPARRAAGVPSVTQQPPLAKLIGAHCSSSS